MRTLMYQTPAVISCHECDLLLSDAEAGSRGSTVACPRCGVALYRLGQNTLEPSLALTCAAVILLALANCFPIVGLNIQGHQVETTVFGAAGQLWRDEMPVVAALLLGTTVLMPSLELGALLWLLLPLWRGYRPAGFVQVFRLLQLAHPWAMVEVFMLGILVSLVKLSHLADVLPGPAIWCFGALMLVLAFLGASLEHRALWSAWEHARA